MTRFFTFENTDVLRMADVEGKMENVFKIPINTHVFCMEDVEGKMENVF